MRYTTEKCAAPLRSASYRRKTHCTVKKMRYTAQKCIAPSRNALYRPKNAPYRPEMHRTAEKCTVPSGNAPYQYPIFPQRLPASPFDGILTPLQPGKKWGVQIVRRMARKIGANARFSACSSAASTRAKNLHRQPFQAIINSGGRHHCPLSLYSKQTGFQGSPWNH